MAASEIVGATTTLNAHVVGNLFVEQYYPILHQQPEEVHKFYMDCSVLSRPDCNGVMQSVTSMQAIDEKVMSVDYKGYTVEIKTVDSQPSYKDGVIVLVTGLLTGKDGIVKNFTQSFFLAPMETSGYFVLNDVLRFVVEDPLEEMESVVVNGSDAPSATPATSPDLTAAPALDMVNAITAVTEENSGCDETHESMENGCIEAFDIPEATSNTSQICVASELVMSSTSFQPLEDTPKKSYASIVKVTRAVAASTVISSPNAKVQTAVVNTEAQSNKQSVAAAPPDAKVHTIGVNIEMQNVKQVIAAASIPHTELSTADNKGISEENGSPPDDVEGYSIYIRNLPLNATPSQVEGEFKKFGPIKSGGVQVRNHKQHGYCFGFVEFEDLSSMESAIEASVTIAGRHIVVEEKRTTTRVGPGGSIISYAGGRGRFPMARGGYRNDGFRGFNMRNDGFRGDGMRNDGFRGDGMRNDGFHGDSMRNDSFRGDGLRSEGFRDRGGYGGGQGFGRNDFWMRGEFFPRGRGGNRSVEGYHRVGRPNINRTAIPAA